MELKIKTQIFPSYPSDIIIHRIYIKLSGKWVEAHKTADCPRHLIIADKTRHFCVGCNDTIRELPPPTIPFMCGLVCDEMKQKFREAIKEYEAYLTEAQKRYMQEYIAKENTDAVSMEDVKNGN